MLDCLRIVVLNDCPFRLLCCCGAVLLRVCRDKDSVGADDFLGFAEFLPSDLDKCMAPAYNAKTGTNSFWEGKVGLSGATAFHLNLKSRPGKNDKDISGSVKLTIQVKVPTNANAIPGAAVAAAPQPVVYAQGPQPVVYAQAPAPQPVVYAQAPAPQPVVYAQAPQPQPVMYAPAPGPQPVVYAQAPAGQPVMYAPAPSAAPPNVVYVQGPPPPGAQVVMMAPAQSQS
jgi:hypothetical protein